MGSNVRIAPIEGHDRIGLIERSHVYLKRVYDKLKIDLPTLSRDYRLSMSFRTMNDVPNSDILNSQEQVSVVTWLNEPISSGNVRQLWRR